MANSETFNFTYSYTNPNNNTVITVSNQPSIVYPAQNVGLLTVLSEKIRGDGYYGRSDGLHTVQISLLDFIGRVEIQATLSANPTEEDWFTTELGTGAMSVDTTGLIAEQNITYVEYSSATTNNKTYNFVGNYIWVRVKVSNWSDGSVRSIRINH